MVALKYAGLEQEELERFSKNKLLVKIFEVLLNLNRIIEEKNCLLQSAVNKLKQSQQDKQKKERENIELYQKIITIREEVEGMIGKNKSKKSKQQSHNFTTYNTSDKDKMTPSDQKRNTYEMTECSMVNNPHEKEDTLLNTDINDDTMINTKYDSKHKQTNDENTITIEDLKVNDIDLEYNENKGMVYEDEEDNNSYNSNVTEIRYVIYLKYYILNIVL